ncbi:hypothetical protein FJTKL_03856 [Diaporthe vaccinii]|uniref:Uncharacterized protein n=1 Tax=Diaporthe vaccinii TaxID=105482 RepID=A0ABR4F1C2_9PEZI
MMSLVSSYCQSCIRRIPECQPFPQLRSNAMGTLHRPPPPPPPKMPSDQPNHHLLQPSTLKTLRLGSPLPWSSNTLCRDASLSALWY